MKYKLVPSIFALLASIIISYAVTIEVFHTHTNFQHNCPICHFQLNDSSDIQHASSTFTFASIQFLELVPHFTLQHIAQESTSRSPPLTV